LVANNAAGLFTQSSEFADMSTWQVHAGVIDDLAVCAERQRALDTGEDYRHNRDLQVPSTLGA
jgi:hypothetical protein